MKRGVQNGFDDTQCKTFENYQEMLEAAKCGDVKAINELHKKGIPVDAAISDNGSTALMYAAQHGQVKAIHHLVEKGADINSCNSNGRTALMYAAEKNQVNAIQALIKLGAKINILNKNGLNALDLASNEVHIEALQILIEHAVPDDKKRNLCKETPITTREIEHYSELVKNYKQIDSMLKLCVYPHQQWQVLKALKNPKTCDMAMKRLGYSDLMRAAVEGDVSKLQKFMLKRLHYKLSKRKYADQTGNWSTLLCIGVYFHHLEIINYLLDVCQFPPHIKYEIENGKGKLNLVSLAKDDFKRHNDFSRYLKIKIGYDNKTLENLTNEFDDILRNENRNAHINNKKLLILVGELHNDYRIEMIQKKMLESVKKLGIDTHLIEYPHAKIKYDMDNRICKRALKLGMKLRGIDNGPMRKLTEKLTKEGKSLADIGSKVCSMRSQEMATEIFKVNTNAICIVGQGHLKEVMELVDKKRFHIVPFNLATTTVYDKCEFHKEKDVKFDALQTQFAEDKNNVINIIEGQFTDHKKVCEKWNQDIHANLQKKRLRKKLDKQSKPILPLFQALDNKENNASHTAKAPSAQVTQNVTGSTTRYNLRNKVSSLHI